MAEKKWVSTGTCALCSRDFKRAGMTRHLTKCRTAHPPAKTSGRTFHLRVEGRGLPLYWMHIEMSAGATLETLDAFLRDLWLECCGHLSAFTIEGVQYEMDTEGVDAMWSGFFGPRARPRSMDTPLATVLRPDLEFSHDYDFGTTTELALKVIGEQEGALSPGEALILARNHPPPIKCEKCDSLATRVCSNCIYQGTGWVCGRHARHHRCGEEMLLPVVNSPRVGMCGYAG